MSLCLIEEDQDEHGKGGDSQFVRLRPVRLVHGYDSFTQGVADSNLSALVLVLVEAAELLELVRDVGGHLQVNR